jgi:orotate phosphoribosyltransferase-like protein
MMNGFMIAYDSSMKEKATTLRKSGKSLQEIAKELNIAKSTASLWLSTIPLNQSALQTIENKKEARSINMYHLSIQIRG